MEGIMTNRKLRYTDAIRVGIVISSSTELKLPATSKKRVN